MGKTVMPDGVKSAMYWALGIGVIALIILVLLIFFGNLSGNIGFGTLTSSYINETIAVTDAGVTPASAIGAINGVLSSVVIRNSSSDLIANANFSITGIVVKNLTGAGGGAMNISYTLTKDSTGKINTDNVISNYTKSATNISNQFPTVGTIIGIALLLVVLIGILVFAITKLLGVADKKSSSGNYEQGNFG